MKSVGPLSLCPLPLAPEASSSNSSVEQCSFFYECYSDHPPPSLLSTILCCPSISGNRPAAKSPAMCVKDDSGKKTLERRTGGREPGPCHGRGHGQAVDRRESRWLPRRAGNGQHARSACPRRVSLSCRDRYYSVCWLGWQSRDAESRFYPVSSGRGRRAGHYDQVCVKSLYFFFQIVAQRHQ